MNRKLTFWKLGLLASALVMLFSYSFADTIVSVTDSSTGTFPGGLFLGGQFSNVVATSWTQSASFSNVTIDALLGSHTSFQSGTAYLMSAIGPGTTPPPRLLRRWISQHHYLTAGAAHPSHQPCCFLA
jgi:hypothetical protein